MANQVPGSLFGDWTQSPGKSVSKEGRNPQLRDTPKFGIRNYGKGATAIFRETSLRPWCSFPRISDTWLGLEGDMKRIAALAIAGTLALTVLGAAAFAPDANYKGTSYEDKNGVRWYREQGL